MNKKIDAITTTIENILKLDCVNEERLYGGFEDFSIFVPIQSLEHYCSNFKSMEHLKVKEYVADYCNDGRSRDLNILTYKGVPFAIYQYMGKGYIENEMVFNQEIYDTFLQDMIKDYLSEMDSCKAVPLDTKYTVRNYNLAHFEIEDNKIYARTDYKY